jgi:hypothetical protein|tara:strand:- start:21 stop:398 length:378 start_codon:yes stop_codon:yes gene_type:complete
MPKPKPDQVIRFEIVMGRAERELVQNILMPWQIKQVATPGVALLSDVSGMATVAALLATWYGFELGIIGLDTPGEIVSAFRQQLADFKESPAYQLSREARRTLIPGSEYAEPYVADVLKWFFGID